MTSRKDRGALSTRGAPWRHLLASRLRMPSHRLVADRWLLLDVGKLQAAQVASALCAVLQMVVITRVLTPTEFGVFSLIVSSAILARQVFESRSSALLIRYHARFDTTDHRPQQRAVIGLSFLLDAAATMLGATLVVALSGWLAERVLQSAAHQPLLHLGALTLVAALGSATAMAILAAERDFASIASAEAIAPWLTLLVVLATVLVSPSVHHLLIAVAAGTALQTVIRWSFAMRALRRQRLWTGELGLDAFRRFGALRPDAREIARFTLGTNVLATLKLMKGNLPALYLGAVLSPAEAGFYLLAQRLIEKIGSFVTPTQQVAYPHLARLVVAGNHQATRRIYVHSILLNVLIVLPFVVIFGVFARWSVPFFFGPQYRPAGAVIAIALFAFAIGATFRARTPLLTAAGKVEALNLAYVAGIVVQWFLLVWLVPAYGSVAAAWALMGFHVVSVAVTFPAALGVITSLAPGPKRPDADVMPTDIDI